MHQEDGITANAVLHVAHYSQNTWRNAKSAMHFLCVHTDSDWHKTKSAVKKHHEF